jgi:GH18 family chitinase
MVYEILPKDKSLSIAALASFWYLQGFDPITDFVPLLDYMVYITYDLHGQWDYNNK